MNCAQAQERFSELLDPRHDHAAGDGVRAHLAHCPACQREFATLQDTLTALDALPAAAPSPRLRAHFHALLEAEKHAATQAHPAVPRRRPAIAWRWILSPLAAGALIAIGFFAGRRTVVIPAPRADDATHRQLAALQEKVDSMDRLVSYSLLQRQPAVERLQGVLATQDLKSPDDLVLTQLISALALDPSTNVRLTALESLYPHADKDIVRAGVLAALGREQNPLVQVAMIDFLVAARDGQAVSTFETLSRKHDTDRSVREAARRALAQM